MEDAQTKRGQEERENREYGGLARNVDAIPGSKTSRGQLGRGGGDIDLDSVQHNSNEDCNTTTNSIT